MKKAWGSQSIRELARRRLKESTNKNALEPTKQRGQNFIARESTSQESLENGFIPKEGDKEFQWGAFQRSFGNRVFLVTTAADTDGGKEMVLLCRALGLECVDLFQLGRFKKIDPANFLGEGTLERLGEKLRSEQCTALVVDAPLSPGQVKNMEKIVGAPVLDREGVILSIFEYHAKTRQAKMQVELAQLKYLQPRLAGLWSGLSRQRGSAGGLGARGLGESRLELDRRIVKDRITHLSCRLKEAEKSFAVQSSRRGHLPRVALVGYTNAGKSTLMRRLTKTPVEAEDKLFSTLDTTVRPLLPPTRPKILLSDTVGFIRDLPHDLVASFKSTLREALDSRYILHVLDISHPQWKNQFETTEAVLNDIGASEIPKVLLVNKVDCLGPLKRIRLSEVNRFLLSYPSYLKAIGVSALTGEGLEDLRAELLNICGVTIPEWSVR